MHGPSTPEQDPRELGPEALLDAAAMLLDANGLDAVSAQQIVAASGHRNRSAITYHFGTRDELIHALVTRTMDALNDERNALLDHLERTNSTLSERTVIEVLVGPLVRQLHTIEGRRYLRLCGQLIDHPRFVTNFRDIVTINSSSQRCAAHLADLRARLPPLVLVERANQAAAFLVRSCSDQARLLDSDQPTRPALGPEDFAANLADTLLAILTCPTTINPT